MWGACRARSGSEKIMDTIKEKVEELVDTILESTEYQSFQEAERQVRKVPGLADKIREFCWENYEIQNQETEDLDGEMEAFVERYRDFRKDNVVDEYLERELRMCRMLQEIHARLTDIMDFVI